MPEFGEMLDRQADPMLDVDIDEAQTGVVRTVSDHDERESVVAKQLGTVVIGEDLEEDDAVRVATAEDPQQLAIAQRRA